MPVKDRVHTRSERTELEVGDCGLNVVTPMRYGVRLLSLSLIDLMVNSKRRKHARQPRDLPVARHAAAIEFNVVARTQEN